MRNQSGRADTDMLRKVEQDLENLPRHQWDSYLWDFCRQFVGLQGGPPRLTQPGGGSRQEPD